MHKIEKRIKPQKRYEGLKPKLIHLEEDVFNILNTIAKMKGLTLKKYIELLCYKQAGYEAKLFMEKYDKKSK